MNGIHWPGVSLAGMRRERRLENSSELFRREASGTRACSLALTAVEGNECILGQAIAKQRSGGFETQSIIIPDQRALTEAERSRRAMTGVTAESLARGMRCQGRK